jgi:4-hydroxy-2-oxovalerate aldolase
MTPKLLECTLRDGSYAVDFQFSADYTHDLSSQLDRLNFPYIEVGHGIGIGASEKIIRAAATDLEYALAADSAIKNAKWGMFAIPGVATPAAIEELFAEGMDFIRIGIDAFAMESGIDLISNLERTGKEVFVNFMKSYALEPDDLLERVERVAALNVDGVYLVDSAGGMLPGEVDTYATALQRVKSSLKLGFHGHDNLGLAVAHSLKLAERGFDLIDCSMQGLGRSSGNASTERLVSLLSRLEIDNSYSVLDVLKVGERLVRPQILLPGYSGLDTFSGYLLFHTSYMEDLIRVSRDNAIDPFMLMQEHCEKTITSGSVAEFQEAAERLKGMGFFINSPLPLDKYVGHEQN